MHYQHIPPTINAPMFQSQETSPTLPVGPFFASCLGAPELPGLTKQKTSKGCAAIAKPRSPTPLCAPSTLRRTKSLSDLNTVTQAEHEKSLFWFRPCPSAPLTPPRKTRSSAKKERRSHRRSKTSPSPSVPRELTVPTLQEDAPILKSAFLRDEYELSSGLTSFFDSTLYSDDEDEEEFLNGLNVLGDE